MKKGKRVLALRDTNETTAYIYGYGTYQGEEIPPSGFCHDVGWKNPKILLDNGSIVWGEECWWGTVQRMGKEFIGERKVVIVELESEV